MTRPCLPLLLLLVGCDSGMPVDVTGAYSGPVTNGANSCPGAWNTGQSSDASANVAQTGSNVSIQMQGAAGLVLTAVFGTNAFTGTVSGSHIDATIIGSNKVTTGGCEFTSNGHLTADLGGDKLTGQIVYTPQTNNHADCTSMMVTGCSRVQTLSFTRPTK